MKRLLIILLSGVLAVVSDQAYVLSRSIKVLRPVPAATSTSGKVVRQLEQQSRRAEQAARAAAAASRLNVRPSGIPIVPVPNLDPDNQGRKKTDKKIYIRPLPKFKPLPKIKTLREMEEERLAAEYDLIKERVNSGTYVPIPFSYFQLADYALRHDDEPFAITCLEQVRVDRLTPKL